MKEDRHDERHGPTAEDSGSTSAKETEGIAPEAIDEETWPIGFMVILTLVVLYLGWRLLQGVGWVIDKI